MKSKTSISLLVEEYNMEKGVCYICDKTKVSNVQITDSDNKKCNICLKCFIKKIIPLYVGHQNKTYIFDANAKKLFNSLTNIELIKTNFTEQNMQNGSNFSDGAVEKIIAIVYSWFDKPENFIEDALKNFDGMVGVEHVMEQVKEILYRQLAKETLIKAGIKDVTQNYNLFLTGNPGTGKTTIAQIIAKIFLEAGIVKKDTFVSARVSDIVGRYVGETSDKTNSVVSKAKGGIFFLDEAYRLADDTFSSSKGGDYGKEAFETIMEHIDKNPDTVYMFAGYEDKMSLLYSLNAGVESRIPNTVKINDYTPSDLQKIAVERFKSLNYNISEVEDSLLEFIKKKADNKALPGNARTILNMVNKIITSHSKRIITEKPEDVTKILEVDILNSDDNYISEEQKANLREVFDNAIIELDSYIGLPTVKKYAKRLGKNQIIKNKRKELGLKVEKDTYHMFFLGNPGTGKTKVARIMGKILRGAGVLSSGHFVEVTKDDLTGRKEPTTDTVKKLVKKAKGGILFIDEAYSLKNDNQGKEAIDCLIREMEEYRDDLVVILVGYENEMKELLKLNPGFESRVPNHISFDDYDAEQLLNIALSMIKDREYNLSDEALKILDENIKENFANNNTSSNGRWVRNIIDKAINVQSERLFDSEDENEDITLIVESDIINTFNELVNDDSEKQNNLYVDISKASDEEKELFSAFKELNKEPHFQEFIKDLTSKRNAS